MKTSNKEVPPGFENDLKNIAIDFDGVIHDFSRGWHDGTCYGDPLPGSIQAIRELSKNFNVIIFTDIKYMRKGNVLWVVCIFFNQSKSIKRIC